jgi:1-acyl-sn-glycerol-3-phosphate acyltransferase
VSRTRSSLAVSLRSALLWFVLSVVAFSFCLCLPFFLLPRRILKVIVVFHIEVGLKAMKLVCGLDWELRGNPQAAGTAVLVASKHQSAWETFVLQCILSDPAIILKRELLLIPFFGWALRKLRHLPIDRAGGLDSLRATLTAARMRIRDGRQIVIFPEGTRKDLGAPPAYQAGVFALYKSLGVPCLPVALNSGCFWPHRGFIFRPGRIVIKFLPPIEPGLSRDAFMQRLALEIEGSSSRLLAEGMGSLAKVDRL